MRGKKIFISPWKNKIIPTLGFSNPGAVIPRIEHTLQTGEIQKKKNFRRCSCFDPSNNVSKPWQPELRKNTTEKEKKNSQRRDLSYSLCSHPISQSPASIKEHPHLFRSYSLLTAKISLLHPNHFCILRPIQRNITGSIFATGWGL